MSADQPDDLRADPNSPHLRSTGLTRSSWGALRPSDVEVRLPAARASDVTHAFSPYLHGARGLFSLMIVVFHVVNSGLPTFGLLAHGWPLFALRSLQFGVELFFGISGIVIFGALRRARSPLVFAAERATRIYPVLWASVATIVLLSALTRFQNRGLPSLPVLLENLLALPPVLPGPLIHPAAWTLSFELVFYGLCAVAWALRRRIGAWAFPLVLPVALVLLALHVRAVLMPVGMIVAWALARHPRWSGQAAAPGLWLIAFLVGWQGFCLLNGGDLMRVTALQLRPVSTLLGFIALFAGALAFAGLLGGRGIFCTMLASAPLQFLGSVSYSLYLWHPILMSMIKQLMYVRHVPAHVGPFSQAVFLGLSLPSSCVVAWVSQQVLEKRVTVWLRRRVESHLDRRSAIRPPATIAHPSGVHALLDASGP